MVKLEDKYVCGLSAAGAGLFAVGNLAFPKQLQDTFFVGPARSDAAHRWLGHTIMCVASMHALAAKSGTLTAEGRKDWHRLSAACWGSLAVHNGVNIQRNIQKGNALDWGKSAAMASLGALHACKGFKKEPKKTQSQGRGQ